MRRKVTMGWPGLRPWRGRGAPQLPLQRQGDVRFAVQGEGPPLILVHGLAGSPRWWARVMPGLAEHFQVYAVGLSGFGDHPRGERFVLAEASEKLALWMEAQGMQAAAVVGHSMGGMVAARLAGTRPDLVDRLVLSDSPVAPFGCGYPRHVLNLCVNATRMAPSFFPVLVADSWRAGPLTILSAVLQITRTDLTEMARRIQAPTLILWGERDALVPLRLGRRLAETIPNATLKVLPRVAHNPMWDRPDLFVEAVLEFLQPESADSQSAVPPGSSRLLTGGRNAADAREPATAR